MSVSRISFRIAAIVSLFAGLLSQPIGFSDEGRGGGESKKQGDKITTFKLVGKTAAPTTSFMIVYHSPYQWRCDDEIKDLVKNVAMCDGKVAWSYSIEGSNITKIEKWNVEKAVKKYGPKLSYECLLCGKALVLFYALANPTHPRWKNEFGFPAYDYGLTRKGEEKINGIDTVVYESEYLLTNRLWFGKEDGVVRKQKIISDQGLFVSDKVVDEISMNVKVSKDLFYFTPPPHAKVIDKTEELLKAIEEMKAAYEKRLKSKGKSKDKNGSEKEGEKEKGRVEKKEERDS